MKKSEKFGDRDQMRSKIKTDLLSPKEFTEEEYELLKKYINEFPEEPSPEEIKKENEELEKIFGK